MTAPKVKTVTVSGDRWYVDEETGEQVPGVSSINGILAKPALIGWAAKMAAEFAVDNISTVSDLAKNDRQAAIDLVKGSHRRSSGKAADAGTEAHGYVELMMKGELKGTKVPKTVTPFLRQFATWAGEFKAKPVLLEATVWSKEFKYAGTLDGMYDIVLPAPRQDIFGNRRLKQRVVVDTKTGASGVWPEAALQQSAYRNADHMVSPGGNKTPMLASDFAFALWLRPNGYAFIPLPDAFPVFLGLRQIYAAWGQGRDKAYVLPPINQKPIQKQRRW